MNSVKAALIGAVLCLLRFLSIVSPCMSQSLGLFALTISIASLTVGCSSTSAYVVSFGFFLWALIGAVGRVPTSWKSPSLEQ